MVDYSPMAQALADWFTEHAADVPWRRTRDPWAILVSETMLQQTRVKTVIPIYESFMERFPTPAALARATEEALLQAWQGLGYYRRAHLLQKAATALVAQWASTLPAQPEDLQTLPGIGAYTSRSVAAIAFGVPTLPIDGNVARVLARIHKRRAATRSIPQTWDAGWAKALQTTNASHAVQALMEVGSTICLPAKPRCALCPLQQGCMAAHSALHAPDTAFDTQGFRWGRTPPRKAPRSENWHALVLTRPDGAVLLVYRPPGLLGSQWGLPLFEAGSMPAAAPAPTNVGSVQHQFTHRTWHIQVYAQQLPQTPETPRWLPATRARWSHQPAQELPATAFQKILRVAATPPGTSL